MFENYVLTWNVLLFLVSLAFLVWTAAALYATEKLITDMRDELMNQETMERHQLDADVVRRLEAANRKLFKAWKKEQLRAFKFKTRSLGGISRFPRLDEVADAHNSIWNARVVYAACPDNLKYTIRWHLRTLKKLPAYPLP